MAAGGGGLVMVNCRCWRLEGALIAMMFFEPLRGLLRRAQYLSSILIRRSIHMVTRFVTLIAIMMLVRKVAAASLVNAAGGLGDLAGNYFLPGDLQSVAGKLVRRSQRRVVPAGAACLVLIWQQGTKSSSHGDENDGAARHHRLAYGLYQLMFGYRLSSSMRSRTRTCINRSL